MAIHAPSNRTAPRVILLDTNALIWVAQGHRRAASLLADRRPLYASPANFLELQVLVETGRVRLRVDGVERIAADPRWVLDDPSAVDWFQQAWPLSWTRDPFDRLLVAHARLRGWKLATADEDVLAHLHSSECVAL